MAAAHSKLSNYVILALAGACFATSVALIYILKKSSKSELVEEQLQVQSTRHTILEVPVPSELVGAVIGRHGTNIDQIQKVTSTKLNFKNDEIGGTRTAIIRGKPSDVHAAEKLLRTLIAERANIMTEEIFIPNKAVGSVIGKSGSNIRLICETSRAKVKVDSNGSGDVSRVTIRGTADEISSAKFMIHEKVALMEERDSKSAQSRLSTANLHTHSQFESNRLLCDVPAASVKKTAPAVEDLAPTGQDGFLEVFISSVESPNRFWVQPVGANFSTQLDKLCEKMTAFYESENQEDEDSDDDLLLELKEGDMVATKFSHDNKWYRATVHSMELDDYDPTNSDALLFFADFGDFDTVKLKDIKLLKPEFQSLPFQAVECKLAHVAPVGGVWSEEASRYFEDITHCCQWKPQMLRVVVKSSEIEGESQINIVELVDTIESTDVRISKQLIDNGFAVSDS